MGIQGQSLEKKSSLATDIQSKSLAAGKAVNASQDVSHHEQTEQGTGRTPVNAESSRGDVAVLQSHLQQLGYLSNGGTDGSYGPGTTAAVTKYQKDNGLEPTGIADEKTQNSIDEKIASIRANNTPLEKGSKEKSRVMQLQFKLVDLGYSTNGIDGDYGDGTFNAVKQFQTDNNLKATGVADPDTLSLLESKASFSTNSAHSALGDQKYGSAQEKYVAYLEHYAGYLEKNNAANLNEKTTGAGSDNYTRFCRDYAVQTSDSFMKATYWCNMYVDSVLMEAFGADNAVRMMGGESALCSATASNMAKLEANKKSDKLKNSLGLFKEPEVGDFILYYDKSGDICHIGVVVETNVGGNPKSFRTIEGNTSSNNALEPNGGAVAYKDRTVGASNIAGFARPDWSVVEDCVNDATASTLHRAEDQAKQEIATQQEKKAEENQGTSEPAQSTEVAAVPASAEESQAVEEPVQNNTQAAASAYDLTAISKGEQSMRVLDMQERLDALGFTPSGGVDGDFGGGTEKAVIAFQQANNLTATGIADSDTLALIYKLMPERPTGAISAKYESRGLATVGYDDNGGTSYGRYQIAAKVGSFDSFVAHCAEAAPESGGPEFAQKFENAAPYDTGSTEGACPDVWRELAQTDAYRLKTLEYAYIKENFLDGPLASYSDDFVSFVNSLQTLKDVFWSASVNHGPGCKKYDNGIYYMISRSYTPGMSAEDFIQSFYGYRKEYVAGNKYEKELCDRYDDECAKALDMLALERAGAFPSSGSFRGVASNTIQVENKEVEEAAKTGQQTQTVAPTASAQPATSNSTPEAQAANLPILNQGSSGANVVKLQNLLIRAGYSLAPYGADGDFGGITRKAVVKFQKAHNLDPDGSVGPLTWAALLGNSAPASEVKPAETPSAAENASANASEQSGEAAAPAGNQSLDDVESLYTESGTVTWNANPGKNAVTVLQHYLNKYIGDFGSAKDELNLSSGKLAEDGDFGWRSFQALMYFQFSRGLWEGGYRHGKAIDGSCGSKTWAALRNGASKVHDLDKPCGYKDGAEAAVPDGDIGETGHRISSSGAAQYKRMKAAAANDGISLSANSSFRSLTTSATSNALGERHSGCIELYADYRLHSGINNGNEAATPGNSNHCFGNAIDFYGIPKNPSSAQGNAKFEWLKQHAADYGFYNYQPEGWHWDYKG